MGAVTAFAPAGMVVFGHVPAETEAQWFEANLCDRGRTMTLGMLDMLFDGAAFDPDAYCAHDTCGMSVGSLAVAILVAAGQHAEALDLAIDLDAGARAQVPELDLHGMRRFAAMLVGDVAKRHDRAVGLERRGRPRST